MDAKGEGWGELDSTCIRKGAGEEGIPIKKIDQGYLSRR